MLTSTILIVGHSHTASVLGALSVRNKHWAAPEGLHVGVVNLRKLMPDLGLTTRDVIVLQPPAPPRLHPGVVAEVERLIVPDSRLYLVSMIGGNAHNVLGLIRAEIPFDFILPEAPQLPLEPGAQLVPYGAMRTVLEQRMQSDRNTLEALRRLYPGVLLHMESPPPPQDDAYVAAALEDFRTIFPSGDVVSATLRYKLWRLHSTIVERYCHELGIIFVQAPVETRDAHGYLASQAYGNATHGNAWYGSRLLGQMEAIVLVEQSERAA